MKLWLPRIVFSLNSFAAAMLALYVALGLGLTNPYWAMMTAYIVSQPLTGSVRSKALYRLLGTMIGAVAAVLMVPGLSNAPELLSLALASWVGVCLAVALLDRTPRSYVFMLGGYTAALIGFPSVTAPGGIFDTAIARVEEIGLGILCATLFHSVFMPQGVSGVLTARVEGFMRDARQWTLDALGGRRDPGSATAHKLAADVTDLYIMATHLPFDTSNFRDMRREVSRLSDRMAMLLPLAAAVGDRLALLRDRAHALSPASQILIEDVGRWVEAGVEASIDDAGPLIERAHVLESDPGPSPSLEAAVSFNLHARLAELVEVYRDCRVLARHVALGHALPEGARPMIEAGGRRRLHLDYGMAAWSGAAAAAAIIAVCAFWITTGWADGATAAMMTAIFMCFFAAMDDPARAIDGFAVYTVLSIPISALYLFAFLPPLDSFPMLVLALAPLLLTGGVLMAIPALTPRVLPVMLGVAGSLAIQESFAPDFARFLNGSLAMVAGVMGASVVTRLVRSVRADYVAQRIVRLSWADIARQAVARHPPVRDAWLSRMVDRVAQLGPRVAAQAQPDAAVADALGELRVGLNVLDLRRLVDGTAPDMRRPIGALLEALNRHFAARARGRPGDDPAWLLARIDQAIDRISREPEPATRRTGLLALVGLRRALFPDSAVIGEAAA